MTTSATINLSAWPRKLDCELGPSGRNRRRMLGMSGLCCTPRVCGICGCLGCGFGLACGFVEPCFVWVLFLCGSLPSTTRESLSKAGVSLPQLGSACRKKAALTHCIERTPSNAYDV